MRRGCLVLALVGACSGGMPDDFIDAPEVDAPVDAGIDARETDAQEVDAREIDAREIDAREIDASMIDAPTIDAPAIDAPVIDATAIDAPTIDAPTIDAPTIDAPTIDAPVIDAPVIDAAAIDAAAIDAPAIDAPVVDAPAIDAPPADAVPDAPAFLSPRVDWSYGANGVGCDKRSRFLTFSRPIPAADGSVLYCYGVDWFGADPGLNVCGPAGTVTFSWEVGGDFGAPTDCNRLSDGRMVADGALIGNPGGPPGWEQVLDLTGSFADVIDHGGNVDFIRRGGPIERFIDDHEWFPPGPLFPAAPTYDRILRCTATHHLVHTTAPSIVRVDAATWLVDPSYGTGSVAVPSVYAVRPDCSLVTVSTTSTSSRITVYDADGHDPSAFDLPIAFVTSASIDPAGRLVVGLQSNAQAPVRVARIDLAARALDPAFGLGGVAELQVPSLTWSLTPTGGAAFHARVIATRPGVIALAVNGGADVGPPPMGHVFASLSFVKLLVDD